MKHFVAFCGMLAAFGATSCALTMRSIGDKCTEGDAVCLDGDYALSCVDGWARAFACTGPQGCASDKETLVVTCDQSEGASGDTPCLPAYEGRAQCAAGGAAYLVCVSRLWKSSPCPAGSVCLDVNGAVSCAPNPANTTPLTTGAMTP